MGRFYQLLTILFTTVLLSAQTATTSLRGAITDPSGAVVPNATLNLKSLERGTEVNATSNAQGSYQFLQVQPGLYELTAAASGFTPVKRRLNLLVDTPATQDLKLSVKQETTQIEVTAETPTVNLQDASIGNAVTQTQIDALPFEGRDPVGVLALQPGVTFVGNNVDVNTDPRQGAVAGARSDQTNITVDGVDNNDQGGFGQPFQGAIRTPLDSIQELRMTTSNSNAESGRSSGAQVSEITRSGTNQFHGSVYEYNRGLVRTANDWFVKKSEIESGQPNVPGKLIRNTFGARVGGPVWKDRVFFFANYEGQRTRETRATTRTVPTAELRQGIVRYLTCATAPNCDGQPETVATLTPQQLASMDPGCVQNGTCPWGGGPNPNVLQAWSGMPLPNTFSFGDGLNFAGFTFAAPIPGKLDTYLVRLDANLNASGSHRIFIKPQMQNDHNDEAPQFPGAPPNGVDTNNSKGISIGYTATLSPSLVNNFRYGFIRQGFATSGLQTLPFNTFRGMDQPFGITSSTSHIVPMHNFVDDLNWVRGNHTLQFGANIRRLDTQLATNANSFLGSSTNVSWLDNAAIANTGSDLDPSAFGFAPVANDFSSNYDNPVTALTGLVTEVFSNYNRDKTGNVLAQGAPAQRHFRAHELEGYVQDQWRMKSNLTITAGVRYTYLQAPWEINGNEVVPSLSLHDWFTQRGQAMQNGQTFNPPVSFVLGGQANHNRGYWSPDKADFAPRFAIAYSPSGDHGWRNALFGGPGKTSIRLGYGMYYDHFGEALVNSFDRFGSFGLATQLGNAAGIQDVSSVPRMGDLNTIPQALVVPPPVGPFPFTTPGDLDSGFLITWGMDDKLHTPYSHVMSAGIQRELPKQFVLEANYVGRLGRHLLQELDLAMPEDIRDPGSGMDYFTAASLLSKAAVNGTPISQLGPIPFFENLFPTAPAGFLFKGAPAFGCAPGVGSFNGKPSATQAMYDMFACFQGNETSALFQADVLCQPACSTLGPFAFFDNQFSSLYAQSTIGTSSYHAANLTLRKQAGALQFQVNYTLSRSEDMGSNPERFNEFSGFGFASQIINSWSPKQLFAPSDFDTRHQLNANWVYALPFGHGRHWVNKNPIADIFLGGWGLSGLWHWTSGYPFSIAPGLGFWATNWQLTPQAVLSGTKPKTGDFETPNGPNVFADPQTALAQFRVALPGESGQRNNLRGPGTFVIDMGLSKAWRIVREQSLALSVEAFNLTNTPTMDVGSLQFVGNNSLANGSQFGNFTATNSKARVMQFGLRYSF